MTNNELFHELYVAYMELLDEYQYEVGFNETYHKYFTQDLKPRQRMKCTVT